LLTLRRNRGGARRIKRTKTMVEGEPQTLGGMDRAKRRLLLWLLAGVMVSCSHGGELTSPPVELGERFSDTGEAPLPAKWWKVLDDPQLHDLVDTALEGNFTLKAAWDRVDQARAVARKEGAGLWPTLDGSASASRTAQEDGSKAEGSGDRTYQDEFSFGLSASYEVDLWGRVRAGRETAELEAEATAQDLHTAALSLSAQVAETWYSLVEQNAVIKLLDQQIATNARYLELIELRYTKGEVSATDVLQQKKLLRSTQTERERIQADKEALEHRLAVLIGKAPRQEELRQRSKFPELPPLPATGLPSQWVRQRPDIRSAFLRLRSSDREIAAAVADRFPRFTISAGFQSSVSEPALLFERWLANIAANLAAPVVDGGRRKAEVERVRAVASERLHAYGQTVLNGVQEVEDALSRERQQEKALKGLREQLGLSHTTVRQLVEKYRKGTVDFLRVLDELRTRQQLEREFLAARGALLRNRIELYRALGGAWKLERPREQTDNHATVGGEIGKTL